MDYEKLYKEALERASHIKDNNTVATPQEVAEFLFPELKESEDEKIRKELLEHCLNRRDGKQICVDASDYRRWAAWLEKQGEKSWSEEDGKKLRDVIRLVEQGAPVQSIRDHYTNWLKSLKPNHWKPSEEQMEGM